MKEENDSITQIEQFKLRIKEKGTAHQSLLDYFGISADEINHKTKKEGKIDEIYQILKKNNITENKYDFREFLETISHLWRKHHKSAKEIKYKIENLFKILHENIKSILSEKEIFSVFRFCRNCNILLILIEQNIISIETIIENTNQKEYFADWNIVRYCYPEIRKYDENCLYKIMIKDGDGYLFKQFVEENDRNLEFFYEVRKEGAKEQKIIELIREDKIDEFISFVEHSPIDLEESIKEEEIIFETFPKELTPIEYSALFGSVAIFKYLYLKNVSINVIFDDFEPNIIKFAIHGRNYEIIHLLEEINEINEELKQNQQKYLKESIKMHFNEIFEYLMGNYNTQITEEIIHSIIIYRNYYLFNQLIELKQIQLTDGVIITAIFQYIANNGNEEIVKMLINQPNLDINSKDIIFD